MNSMESNVVDPRKLYHAVLTLLVVVLAAPLWSAQRTTLSLHGRREIADSVDAGGLPAAYSHKAPVPGLAHSTVPGFKESLYPPQLLLYCKCPSLLGIL